MPDIPANPMPFDPSQALHYGVQFDGLNNHSTRDIVGNPGRVPKRTKGADCKSAIRRFESGPGLFIISSFARPFIIKTHRKLLAGRMSNAITPNQVVNLGVEIKRIRRDAA
jgi:hypothetical protein